jgi:aspartate kinase
MRVVAKFGGTSLGTGERIEQAADAVAEAVDQGHEVVVVASAMGDTTDQLLDDITFDIEQQDRDEIVSMGERTSIRMLKAALASRGVDARFLEPGADDWPLQVAAKEVDARRTQERCDALADGLDAMVPVVAGFLAEDEDGSVTTLERGGSDTSAMILGNYLDADRVVIVTDVAGVLTGNPEVVEQPDNMMEISVDELRELSFRGAEVIAPRALNYKEEDMDVHIVHYQEGDLLESGTSIEGRFEQVVDARDDPLACLTVAGQGLTQEPGILAELTSLLSVNNLNVYAVGSGADSVALYVDEDDADRAQQLLHNRVVENDTLSGVTLQHDIAAVRVMGGKLPDRPGMLNRAIEPISDAMINIQEVVTSATSITIFVDWEDRMETRQLARDALEV